MNEQIERSPAERIDALIALEAELCRLQAEKLRLIDDIAAEARSRSVDEIDRLWIREELALALRISGAGATDLICLAREAARLPDALTMLEKGQISLTHLRILAESCCGLNDEQAAKVQLRVLPAAEHQSAATFRRQVRKAVMAANPQRADEAHEIAMADRRVVYTPVDVGMSEIWALLPADGAMTLMAALNHITLPPPADSTDPVTMTADQRRADALVHLAASALAGVPAATAALGGRPHIQVTVAASTLAGLDNHPADLDGHGPIPASLARTIAADPTSRWRRLLLDDSGQLMDYGRTTYRPPANLAGFVTARDRVCQRPNCNRAASGCELDHVIDWKDGGDTNAANLQALCPRDHHVKHDAPDWTVTRDGNTTIWTTPTGHRYTSQPQPYDIPNPDPPPD